MFVFRSQKIPAKLIGARVRAQPVGFDVPMVGRIYQADRWGFRFECVRGKVRCHWDCLHEVLDKQLGIEVTRRGPKKP